jgi:hypothetical protein
MTGYGLGNGTCTLCAAGYYSMGGSSQCMHCPNNCANCTYNNNTGNVTCTSCAIGYGFSNGSCAICPTGQYGPGGSLACANCPTGCYNCSASNTTNATSTNQTNCYSCNVNFGLYNTTCRNCSLNGTVSPGGT